MTRPEDPDDRIETHPDLIDPEWQKHAELDAWLGAKKEMKKRRRRAPSGRGYGAPAKPSRWPGAVAILGLVLLLAAAVIVHRIQGQGVNETSIEYTYTYSSAAHPFTTKPPA
ncbi:MAG TPA: hypothetical protein VG674_23965 [Amycolatopsis sp.]|nr:hypothetical protein [Amycolatopsis sp.]